MTGGCSSEKGRVFYFQDGLDGCFCQDKIQQPIVWGNEDVLIGFDSHDVPAATHTRIDHTDKDAVFREKAVLIPENETCSIKILGRNLMGQVDHRGRRYNARDNTFHHTDITVGFTKIGEQYDGSVVNSEWFMDEGHE